MTLGEITVSLKRGAGGERRVEIGRSGIPEILSCNQPGIWVDGKALDFPAWKLRRIAGGWELLGEVRIDSGTWRIRDVLRPRGNTLVVEREWKYSGTRLQSARLGFSVDVPFKRLDFWAMPYISMNGNPGTRTVPRGMTFEGDPWIFREERTTAPGLMILESAGVVAGAYTTPCRGEGDLSSCSIIPKKDCHTLQIFFPFREGPRTFMGAAFPGNSKVQEQGLYTGGSGFGRGMSIEGKARFSRKFFVVLDEAGEKRHGYSRIWESAWKNLRAPIAPAVGLKRMEKVLWRSLEPFWFSKGKVRGYVLRIDRNGGKTGGFSPSLCTSWSGPTMMLTWLGIRRAIKAHDPRLAEKPIQASEFFIDHAPRRNGAFLTHYNVKTMSWSEGDINAVQLGGAAYWLLRCVDLLKRTDLLKHRVNIRKWTSFSLDVCELAVRTQRADGAFCARFGKDGSCQAFERAMGVHTARAVLEAYRQTGKKEYLRAVVRGAEFYIRTMVDKESGYGDCTDLLNSTTENDGAFVADFFIDLYRVTGKKRYLDKAVKVAEFCLQFMFTYNVYFPPETECGRRKMRTRGFSAISPETGFVCFWFALQGNAFLDLWKETGDKRWREYAIAIIRGSMQMIAEPGDTFGLSERMVGSRAEVIPVLDTIKGGHVWKKGMTGYTWHQPVWWPAGFNLLNFAFVEDNYGNVMKDI